VKIDWKQWVFVTFGIIMILVGGGFVIICELAWYWAVAVFVAAFVCFSFVAIKQEKRRVEAYFSGRPVLDEKEFGENYFPADRAEIAAKLRQILSNHVGIDLARVNPNDRFIEDLRMDDYDSMSTVEYVIEVEKEFGIEISDAAAEKMTTFQSVVDYVAEAIKNKAK
jgi:acyl carrier protein